MEATAKPHQAWGALLDSMTALVKQYAAQLDSDGLGPVDVATVQRLAVIAGGTVEAAALCSPDLGDLLESIDRLARATGAFAQASAEMQRRVAEAFAQLEQQPTTTAQGVA